MRPARLQDDIDAGFRPNFGFTADDGFLQPPARQTRRFLPKRAILAAWFAAAALPAHGCGSLIVVRQAGEDVHVVVPGMVFVEQTLDETRNHDRSPCMASRRNRRHVSSLGRLRV